LQNENLAQNQPISLKINQFIAFLISFLQICCDTATCFQAKNVEFLEWCDPQKATKNSGKF
jgi:hypothetical protein